MLSYKVGFAVWSPANAAMLLLQQACHQCNISGASVAHLALGHFVVPELAHLLKPGMQPVIAYRLACTKFRFHCRGESLGRCFAMAILFGDNSLSSPDKLSST